MNGEEDNDKQVEEYTLEGLRNASKVGKYNEYREKYWAWRKKQRKQHLKELRSKDSRINTVLIRRGIRTRCVWAYPVCKVQRGVYIRHTFSLKKNGEYTEDITLSN